MPVSQATTAFRSYDESHLYVQLEGILTEGQSDDYTFDAVWDSAGRLTADGYVVRVIRRRVTSVGRQVFVKVNYLWRF